MNLVGFKTGLLGGAAMLAVVAASVPAYAQDDIGALKQQLDAMKERLAKLEADKAEKKRVAAAAAVEAGDKPRSWKLPGTNTSMNIGGFVKLSTYVNFTGAMSGNGIQANEGAGAGAYPNIAGSQGDNRFNGGHVDMLSRRSRFWIQTWTPTDWGELRTYIEADFAGPVGGSTNPAIAGPGGVAIGANSRSLRLRQAFATLGPVMVGQAFSTFGSLIGAPEALDDGAPIALGAFRVPQIRYSHNFGGGLVAHFALEDAGNLTDAGNTGNWIPVACAPGTNTCAALSNTAYFGSPTALFLGPQRWPDFIAALQWNIPNGAFYASGVIGQRFMDNGTGLGNGLSNAGLPTARHADTMIWGVSLAGRYDFGRVEIGGQGFVGRGIGTHYNGPPTGFNDTVLITPTTASSNSASAKAILSYGGIGYTQVKLTDTIRTTAWMAWAQQNLASEIPGYYNAGAASSKPALGTGAASNFWWTAAGNILWNPVPQVTFGAEYSYQFSSRYNGPNLTVQRLQLAAIYRF